MVVLILSNSSSALSYPQPLPWDCTVDPQDRVYFPISLGLPM